MREVRGRIRNSNRRRGLIARLHLFADGPETVPQWMLACLFARIPPVSRTPPAPLSSEDIAALRERTCVLRRFVIEPLQLSNIQITVYAHTVRVPDVLSLRCRYASQSRGEHAVLSDYEETGQLPPLFHLPEHYVRERSAFYLDMKPETAKK